MSNEPQMDALVIHAAGPPADSLAIRTVSVPQPIAGDVLVEVHAAAVNPLDAVNALGMLGTPLPMIPGVDFAGVVVSEGEWHGQEVWGSAPQLGMMRAGSHAPFVALPETWLSRKPARLSMIEAAAIGRSHLAAWETLIEVGQLKAGETILITGGAGMVGQAATDIARWRGAVPIVADLRRPDGVEHFIDTNASDVREAVLEITDGKGADMVLDAVGGALFEPALRSLRFGGRMAGLISHHPRVEFDLADFYGREIKLTGLASVFMDGPHIARVFDQMAALFDRGVMTPPATTIWPIEQSAQAYEAVLAGTAGIKQVLLPAGDSARRP
jgi:NADPH:quinone reductase-like Zn-dependent oxidoreductase